MAASTLFASRFVPIGIIQPVAISAFTVLVLAASFFIGKQVGFNQGIEYAQINGADLHVSRTSMGADPSRSDSGKLSQ